MNTYEFRGRLTLRDALIYVEANNMVEAKAKAEVLDIVDCDINGAEWIDFEPNGTPKLINDDEKDQ